MRPPGPYYVPTMRPQCAQYEPTMRPAAGREDRMWHSMDATPQPHLPPAREGGGRLVSTTLIECWTIREGTETALHAVCRLMLLVHSGAEFCCSSP